MCDCKVDQQPQARWAEPASACRIDSSKSKVVGKNVIFFFFFMVWDNLPLSPNEKSVDLGPRWKKKENGISFLAFGF